MTVAPNRAVPNQVCPAEDERVRASLHKISPTPAFPKQISWLLVALVTLLGLGVSTALPARAQTEPQTNPDLPAACGLNIVLVLDESSSLLPHAATVRASVRGLLEALADTGSSVALVEFNLDARMPLPAGPDFRPVTSGPGGTISPGGLFDDYLTYGYVPNDFTNWDAAFGQVAEINQNNGVAPLVIFVTDNHPTVYTNQFGSIVGADDTQALDEAVASANVVKGQGSHIFVVGVGDIGSEAPIIAISGPARYPDGEDDLARADYVRTDFDQLATALRQIVFGLCGPSVTVTKYVDQGTATAPVAGQAFTGSVQIEATGVAADDFVWLQPTASNTDPQRVPTAADGTAQWQWIPGTLANPQPWASNFRLDEVPQRGHVFESASCTRKTLDVVGGFTSNNFTVTALPATFAVGPNDLITCDVYNARLALAVQKDANPTTVPESGAPVVFAVDLTNHGTQTVTVESLLDSHFGDLNTQGSCVADGSIELGVGLSYQCAITATVAGNRGTPHTNIITATAKTTTGKIITATAAATVTFHDAQPRARLARALTPNTLNEPGGTVTHTITVTNSSLGESFTITELVDLPFGDLTVTAGAVQSTSCAVPQTLAPAGQAGAVYRCTFTVQVTGNPGPITDTLTLRGRDDEGNGLQLTNKQSVQIKNLLPAVAFQATLIPEERNEPGGDIQLSTAITNVMQHETVTVTALSTTFLQLGQDVISDCTLPQTLPPGTAYRCSFQGSVLKNAGTYSVTTTATVGDDDGSVIQPMQTQQLHINNLPASIAVTVNADRTTLAEPGDDVTFTVAIKNTSSVDAVAIESVVDDHFGDLARFCQSPLPATLAPDATLQCDFIGNVTGAVGSIQHNEVTVNGTDDDGMAVSDSDLESIEITDVPARLAITQIAQPANLPEPGGVVTVTTFIRNISLTDDVTIDRVETNAVDLVGLPATRQQSTGPIDIGDTCIPALPTTLAPNATLQCQFNKVVVGPIQQRHISRVAVHGRDDETLELSQNSHESIDIIDLPSSIRLTESSFPVSVPEAGATVSFTVAIKNTSKVDAVTIESLTNDRFGDLRTSCPLALPLTLAPGATINCRFSQFVTGDVNTLLHQQTTVTATDDDGLSLMDESQSAIGITDTPATLKIIQLATPSGVAEPGGEVNFAVSVRNTSAVDVVTIQRLEESRRGNISDSCEPALPQALAPGATLRCTFSEFIGGNAFASTDSTITVTGIDDDAVVVQDFDLLAVDVLDLLPNVVMSATATPDQLLESGGDVTMRVTLANESPEVATVLTLSNTISGDLNGVGTCLLPQQLAANGGRYSCSYTQFISSAELAQAQQLAAAAARVVRGGVGDQFVDAPLNQFRAVVGDDEGNEQQVSDEAAIFLLAVAPDLQHSKSDELLIDLFDDPADQGKISPGDTIRYLIQISNQGNGAAEQVVLEDTPDPNSSLIVGSVTTNRGTVLVGNGVGDEFVTVLLGNLAIGETATVQFDVLIRPGTGTTLLRNQAFLSHGSLSEPGGTNVSGSDDPNTPFLGDPTDTIVFIPPTNLEPGVEPVRDSHSLYLPMILR